MSHLRYAFLLTAALGACATTGSGGGRSSSASLTAAEFEAYASQDLYTIIQQMRPQWLRVRGGVTALGTATVSVIIDGMKQSGSLALLRYIRGIDVQEVRYLSARDATYRYGTNMAGGAIEIDTKRRDLGWSAAG